VAVERELDLRTAGYPFDAALCRFRFGRLRFWIAWRFWLSAVITRARCAVSTPGFLTRRRVCVSWPGCVGGAALLRRLRRRQGVADE
jgi:hypothetical protein